MKTTILLTFLCLSSLCAAQSVITLLPADTNTFRDDVDLSDPWGYVNLPPSIAIRNNTNDTLNIVWNREIPAGCPLAWEFQISDIYDDYVPWIGSNVIDSLSLSRPLPLLPFDTIEYILVNLRHKGTAGCCNVAMHFSDFNAPDSILATAQYNFRINDPDCLLVDVEEEMSEAVRIYPNPSTGPFYVEPAERVEKVAVYDLHGKKLAVFDRPPYTLEGLAPGVYFLQVTERREKTVFYKILKQ